MFRPHPYLLFLVLLSGLSGLKAQPYIAQDLVVTEAPCDFHVEQRDTNNQCHITIKGYYTGTAPLRLYRLTRYGYNEQWATISVLPIVVNPDSSFEIEVPINAELREWIFGLLAGTKKLMEFKNVVCGDVYAVLGQSNGTSDLGGPEATYQMNGDTFNYSYADRYARALGQGIWGLEANRYRQNWYKWGPAGAMYYDKYHAGGWPLKLQHDLIKKHKIPIGVINASLSGSTIGEHFKDAPPIDTLSINATLIHDNPANLNAFEYFLSKLDRAGARHSLKYIFWYQGESDVDYSQCTFYYQDQLKKLKKDWASALPGLERIFLFQLNTSCLMGNEPNGFKIREAQRQFCLSDTNVFLIPTSGLHVDQMSTSEVQATGNLNQPCHYNRFGMEFLANRVFPLVSGLIYSPHSFSPEDVSPNDLLSARLNDTSQVLTLTFRYPLSLDKTNDLSGQANIKDYFFDQDYRPIPVSEFSLVNNTLQLTLTDPIRLEKLSMMPATFYHHTQRTYYGPWLLSAQGGMGVPFFADVPIEHTLTGEGNFQKKWTNAGLGNLEEWKINTTDRIVAGNFTEGPGQELVKVDSSGSVVILTFEKGTWKTAFYSPNALPPGHYPIYPGDFNGNGKDELLLENAGQLFEFNPLSGFTKVSGIEVTLNRNDRVLIGNFKGNAAAEILLVDALAGQMKLIEFNTAGGQLKMGSILVFNSENSTIPWTYKKDFLSGDFDNDGKHELLAFGEGAVMMRLVNEQWEPAWSATLFNHFKGWEYPLDVGEITVLAGELDPSHGGDELLFLDEKRGEKGFSAFGFSQASRAWEQVSAPLATQPFLGDWPLQSPLGRNSQYHLILLDSAQAPALLTFREYQCGGEWSYESSLYGLHLRLTTAAIVGANENEHFTVYPQPTSSLVHVEYPFQLSSPTVAHLFDSQGSEALYHEENFAPNNFILSLSHLPAGIYFLQLVCGTLRETHKIVITK